MNRIETDYLVVGAGAAGMAFTDALIAAGDADVVMVDRRHAPGGHWLDAYPFVRIHQASACYGVNSMPLGTETIDQSGPNAGLYERSTAVEICAYFQQVMERVLLPSGQVRFLPCSAYTGDWQRQHTVHANISGETSSVHVRRAVVDTTYLEVTVPATHERPFAVDEDLRCVPVGDLVNLAHRPAGYTLLGGGKTAMDACCWLLEHGEDPDRIRWIRPREAWLVDRYRLQPRTLVANTIESVADGIVALAEATSLDDLFRRLEDCGELSRLDRGITPTMFRGAILSADERAACQRVERVVRSGRVRRIGAERIELEDCDIPTSRDELHVDCTARGFRVAPVRQIFESGRIVVQSLIGGLTTYYAALIGFIESTGRDVAEKNRLCPPVAQFDQPSDWIRYVRGVLQTAALHANEPDIVAWQAGSRLNITYGIEEYLGDPRLQAARARWETHAETALRNADRLLADRP